MSSASNAKDGLVSRMAEAFGTLSLSQRLKAAREGVEGRVVFTTSFGLEDQAITHAIFSEHLEVEVITLDTGRLFPETYDVWEETERRYGHRIQGLYPDQRKIEPLIERQGINGFRASVEARQSCCFVRKVEPLGRALAGAAAWVTGVRGDQSDHRAGMTFVSFDEGRGLIKVNPLLDWTRDDVADFVRAHDVPYNALHDRGFLSIGCAPCTRAVAPGEPERAGRWWWEQEEKKECGLHTRRAALAAERKRRTLASVDA